MNTSAHTGNPQDLLNKALNAHGGLDRWNSYPRIEASMDVGGLLWQQKGHAETVAQTHYTAKLHRQEATLHAFGGPTRRVEFSPERLQWIDESGHVLDQRDQPRRSFEEHTNEAPWDLFHTAYFNSYALWTYLTQPFLYTYPGIELEELEPWKEGGETWRRLLVTFPDTIATHTRQQISYFDADCLIRRHDYAVDVLGGARGCQYIDAFEEVGGIVIPRKRRVYPLGDDNRPHLPALLVSIDINEVVLAA